MPAPGSQAETRFDMFPASLGKKRLSFSFFSFFNTKKGKGCERVMAGQRLNWTFGQNSSHPYFLLLTALSSPLSHLITIMTL